MVRRQRRPRQPAARPDEAACAEHLAALRWPEGFVCPRCDARKGWRVEGGRGDTGLWECAACHRQTSATAGTAFHRSKLPLRVWFTALHIVTSHSNGIGALQPQSQLGLGSWNTAWLMLRKIRAAMAAPEGEGSLLRGMVEVDEASIPCRSKDDDLTADSRGRSHLGKEGLPGEVPHRVLQGGRAVDPHAVDESGLGGVALGEQGGRAFLRREQGQIHRPGDGPQRDRIAAGHNRRRDGRERAV